MTTMEDLGWTRVVVPKKDLLKSKIRGLDILSIPDVWEYRKTGRHDKQVRARLRRLHSDHRKRFAELWGRQDWCHVERERHYNWGWTNGHVTILVMVSKRGTAYSAIHRHDVPNWDAAQQYYVTHGQYYAKFLDDVGQVILEKIHEEEA